MNKKIIECLEDLISISKKQMENIKDKSIPKKRKHFIINRAVNIMHLIILNLEELLE